MKRNLLMAASVAICVGFSGAAQAAFVRFETSAASMHVGDTATVALHWDGRGGPSLWSWGVTIDFDPTVIQPGFVGWGSRDFSSQGTGNQLACPGPTRATCTHVGGWIDIAYNQAGHLMMSEGSYAEPSTLNSLQADQFDLLWVDFVAVGEGSSPLSIHPDGHFMDAHFLSGPGPMDPFIAVTVTEGQLDVVPMPETATLWLGLAGLAALACTAALRHVREGGCSIQPEKVDFSRASGPSRHALAFSMVHRQESK
ncbi:MAG: hypothetical protein ACKVOX_13750 [Rhizobacter sp.]